jgi:NTP pyrophosphatase (non-canonical NTP hydrolase)
MRQFPLFIQEPPTDDDIHDADNYIEQAREIYLERIRAHQKHDTHGWSIERREFDDPRWLSVVVKEVGEVGKAINEEADIAIANPSAANRVRFKNDLREELIQTMAMCSAWIDAIDMDES